MYVYKLNCTIFSGTMNQSKLKNVNQKNKYQNLTFGSNIPQDEIHKLSDTFLQKSENITSEISFFQMASEYFKTHLLSLIKGSSKDKLDSGDLLRLFRHELINNVMAAFELNLNPDFKDFVEEENAHIEDFSYLKHQKKTFSELVATVKDMANLWSKIENWKFNKQQEVTFAEMLSTLKNAAKYGNSHNAHIEFKNNLDSDGLVTRNAFEQYDVLSQIVLNSLKYSEGKPVTITFTKTPEHQIQGDNVFTMIAENHGTKPIKDEDIDKILEGKGHRSNDRNINGTGVGYTEVVDILKHNYDNAEKFNLIEKGRKDGVRVIVPFKLEKNNKIAEDDNFISR